MLGLPLDHLARGHWPDEIRRPAARAASPRRRSSNGNSLCGQNSAGSRESARPFKGIICDDISEFESDHLSHAVRSPRASICTRDLSQQTWGGLLLRLVPSTSLPVLFFTSIPAWSIPAQALCGHCPSGEKIVMPGPFGTGDARGLRAARAVEHCSLPPLQCHRETSLRGVQKLGRSGVAASRAW
jgi:hypothetical protein